MGEYQISMWPDQARLVLQSRERLDLSRCSKSSGNLLYYETSDDCLENLVVANVLNAVFVIVSHKPKFGLEKITEINKKI